MNSCFLPPNTSNYDGQGSLEFESPCASKLYETVCQTILDHYSAHSDHKSFGFDSCGSSLKADTSSSNQFNLITEPNKFFVHALIFHKLRSQLTCLNNGLFSFCLDGNLYYYTLAHGPQDSLAILKNELHSYLDTSLLTKWLQRQDAYSQNCKRFGLNDKKKNLEVYNCNLRIAFRLSTLCDSSSFVSSWCLVDALDLANSCFGALWLAMLKPLAASTVGTLTHNREYILDSDIEIATDGSPNKKNSKDIVADDATDYGRLLGGYHPATNLTSNGHHVWCAILTDFHETLHAGILTPLYPCAGNSDQSAIYLRRLSSLSLIKVSLLPRKIHLLSPYSSISLDPCHPNCANQDVIFYAASGRLTLGQSS
ncbi:unnamed protein product [Protopolystoma xenopodis]|uniref:Uncharacterized protein n=1 Tax=Protopolystoma xenopodis TaxID=117903 RepID=A0A448WCC4_9PLAT|nr:unnamed protein product [Protopolystoma xenopodis]